MDKEDEIAVIFFYGLLVADFLVNTGRVLKALELYKECLVLVNNKAMKKQKEFVKSAYKAISSGMVMGYQCINDHVNEMECRRKLLDFLRERAEEDEVTFHMAHFYACQRKYKEAIELCKKAASVMMKTGDKVREASCYSSIGTWYRFLSNYKKAEEYQKKALFISKETSDQKGEAACYGHLGAVYQCLGKYDRAIEYQEIALVICKEIGDRATEASCYSNLGNGYQSLSEYGKALEYHKKAIAINKEIGERGGEAACYGNLGTVYKCLGKHDRAVECHKIALLIYKEIGNRLGEAACLVNLGTVFCSLGKYDEVEEYQMKALVISKETGDRCGEAACYRSLGSLFYSLGEYGSAEEYDNKALVISKQIGDRKGEALSYSNLGVVYLSLAEYGKAEEYLTKALEISKEIGSKGKEAAFCGNLGALCEFLGEYGRAEEYQNKALEIRKEIGDRDGEAASYRHLGSLFRSLGKYVEAKEYHEKALAISNEIGILAEQFTCHCQLALDMMCEGNIAQHEIVSRLFSSIQKSEEMWKFLRANDQFKISLLDLHVECYHTLSALFCKLGNPSEALYIVELGRARALADLMSARYAVKLQVSVISQSRFGIERIMNKENNCSCLYISYRACCMFLWVVKVNKPVLFRQIDVNECFVSKGSNRNVHEVFSEGTVRKFGGLPQEHCEDRSLFLSNPSDSARESSQRDGSVRVRLVEDEEDENQQPVPTLAECYKMIIAPVADFLDKPEIVILPDRLLYKVPFAALKDESGNYLSESFRIRIVPSLTTLKLIQDSAADYHSQTGALIVGEPDVSEVLYKGRKERLPPLPCARREAEMIGKLLGVQPLLGKQATKQAVLQSIHSVSLIHFAAHGNAERGEIALTPQSPINAIPSEEDYLLTMADISQVRLRAKLVVLSCCHTARGQIRSEGVVGIARAFLGSGARSVLVALWALGDSATEKLMSCFYEHLVRGESASESLHQAMKWMRTNGYPDVRDWAPFMLIGDNVTFDFGK